MDSTNSGEGTSGNPTGSPAHSHSFAVDVDSASVQRGHEIDSYDNKSVLSVPLLVVVFFALAFTTVTIVFSFVSKSEPDANANPMAVKVNEAPLNERLNDIHLGSKEVNQPRLEPLRLRTGDERAITRPETVTGNSPELHPEDIRPSKENTPELYKTGWLTPDKSVGHITINEAMELAIQMKKFPTQKDGTEPPRSTHVPTAANAGRGAGSVVATPPKLPGAVEPKK
jgi:hypothetical protein